MALIKSLRGFTPEIGENCFLTENATIVGQVSIGSGCSIWFNTVLRGDVNYIKIGDNVNIQDGVIITPGEMSRFDFGASAKIMYSFTPMENIDIATKLDLFNNYTDPNEKNRINIDVNSETSVNMKINSYISANIFLHMIYDHDIPIPLYKKVNGVKTQYGTGARLQTKQTLGIGFSYNFK